MTWYKQSKLETFTDRNRLNGRIVSFKQLAGQLKYLQKYVFQNAPDAKQFVEGLAKDKRISSFPNIIEKLTAAGRIALDNYKTFAVLCQEIMDDIVREVNKMEKERDGFVKKITLKEKEDDDKDTKI